LISVKKKLDPIFVNFVGSV